MTKVMMRFIGAAALLLAVSGGALATEPVRIGAIFSVTGPASFIGEPERNAARMFVDDINANGGLLGRKIELIDLDDESDATKAVTAFERLVKKEKVVAVIGPSISGNTLAVGPKAEESKILLVSCAAAKKITTPARPYTFKVAASDLIAVKRIFSQLKKQGIAKVAILTASDGYGAGGREDLKELAPAYGIAIVADEVFGPKDTDMTAQLTKVKGTDAQAIVCWGTNPGPAVIARNRVQLGIKTPLYMSSGVASMKFIELAGKENAEGIMLPAGRLIVEEQVAKDHPQKKLLKSFRDEYQRKFKQDVSTFAGHAWDALAVLTQAMKVAKSDDPVAVRNALEGVKGVWGTAGEFNYSPLEHTGLSEDAFVMVRITNGDFALLK